jgi:hypothetical protein
MRARTYAHLSYCVREAELEALNKIHDAIARLMAD